MRQLRYHLKKPLRSHSSPKKRRKVTLAAALIAVFCLGVYSLCGCAASPYASSGAESGIGSPCRNPTVIPMNPRNAQSGVTAGNYYVTNDSWNTGGYVGLSQVLHVCSYHSWYAMATMNNATGDFAVKTSPNVQETWYPIPTKLTSWKAITSRFSDVPPGVGSNYGIWEFEYDIWLNGLADSKSTEVMIWTYNNGQTPRGAPNGSFTDAGHAYDVYRSPPPYQYIAFVARSNSLSGSVNLLEFFRYAISRGWMPSSSTLYQICDGVELVTTNSRPERFAINNFSISMKAYS
jgi:hypothetical protein